MLCHCRFIARLLKVSLKLSKQPIPTIVPILPGAFGGVIGTMLVRQELIAADLAAPPPAVERQHRFIPLSDKLWLRDAPPTRFGLHPLGAARLLAQLPFSSLLRSGERIIRLAMLRVMAT
jgi:hypothetical protein